MQVYGAEGIGQDTPLAAMYAALRTLRYADVSLCISMSSRFSTNYVFAGSGRGSYPTDRESRIEASTDAGRAERTNQLKERADHARCRSGQGEIVTGMHQTCSPLRIGGHDIETSNPSGHGAENSTKLGKVSSASS